MFHFFDLPLGQFSAAKIRKEQGFTKTENKKPDFSEKSGFSVLRPCVFAASRQIGKIAETGKEEFAIFV